jgi:hypothetical protein
MGCGTERCLGSDDAAGYSSDNVAWSVTSASNRDVERNLDWRDYGSALGIQQVGRNRLVRGHESDEPKAVRYPGDVSFGHRCEGPGHTGDDRDDEWGGSVY